MSTANSLTTMPEPQAPAEFHPASAAGIRAMIWKELRENGKWAAVGLLGIAGGMAYALRRGAAPTSYMTVNSAALTSDIFFAATVGGMAAVALGLGLLQILPEKRRDQWALLVHRPVTRETLFWSKAIAGLGLYILAAGIPLLGACLWVATPGHVAAPFGLAARAARHYRSSRGNLLLLHGPPDRSPRGAVVRQPRSRHRVADRLLVARNRRA